jgi:uncharacterized protein (DUF2147 family)
MTALTRLGAAAVLALIPATAFAQTDAPAGTWRHPDQSIIKFYGCEGGLCAQIVKARNPGAKDAKNPDSGKRDQKIDGLIIMKGAQKVSSTEWHGKLYNPEDGSTYDGKVVLLSGQELKLQGCGLGGFVCKGETLTRVAN